MEKTEVLKNHHLLISFESEDQRDNLLRDIEKINALHGINLTSVIEDGIYPNLKFLKISGFTSLNEAYSFGHLAGRNGHY